MLDKNKYKNKVIIDIKLNKEMAILHFKTHSTLRYMKY